MIESDSWINLPVGYNLVDHVNVSIPGIVLDMSTTDGFSSL